MDRLRELSLLKQLRVVLERTQAKVGVRFSLEDADLREWQEHGIEVVAAMVGAAYNITDLPENLESISVVAAASRALSVRAEGYRSAGGDVEADALDAVHRRLDEEITRKLKGKRDVQHH